MPVVPQSATLENQEGLYVYVLDEQNLPKMVYIKTMGQTDDNMWIVSEGVKKGDKILTSGMQKVIPGKPVKIVLSMPQDKAPQKKQSLFSKILGKK